MNDKIIIKLISNIYFIIVSIFTSSFIVVFVGLILLQEGIYINKISIPIIKIEKLYIKWNEKIDISIKNIIINPQKQNNNTKFDLKTFTDNFKYISYIHKIFEKISIDTISIQDINTSLQYDDKNGATLKSTSDNFIFDSSLKFNKNTLLMTIDTLKSKEYNININGTIILNKKFELYTQLHTNINNEVFLNSYTFSNQKKMLYKIKSLKEVLTIDYVVDIFNLPQSIKYWIIDALDMSSLKLLEASGKINFNDLTNAYKDIYIKADVNNLHYKYNQNLDAVHSKHTLIEFKEGKLIIKPKEAYSYNQYLGDSWVQIDFSKKEIPLSIYLIFEGVLNKDVLKILDTYNIKLPFLQKKGTLQVNLQIDVDLTTIKVNAVGDFFIKEANVDYIGLNLDLFDAHIILDGYKVTIDNMFAKYEDIMSADVDVDFNAYTQVGKVDFRIKEISLNGVTSDNKDILTAQYNIVPNQNSIYVEKSQWRFKNQKINVDKLLLPFDTDNLILKIPTSRVTVDSLALLYVSGERSFKTNITNLDMDLIRFAHSNLLLAQYKADLKIIHDKDIQIKIDDSVLFKFNGIDFSSKDLNIKITEDIVDIKSFISLKNIGISDVQADYNLSSQKGTFELSNISIKNAMFNREKPIKFNISSYNNLTIDSKELNLLFTNNKYLWSLNIDDTSVLLKNSPLLQSFDINKGDMLIKKYVKKRYIDFDFSFDYPHPILLEDKKPITNYKFVGTSYLKKDFFNLNYKNLINIKIDKNNIDINMKDLGIDVHQISTILDKNSSNKKESNIKLKFNASNSYIYIGKNRKIISDTINLTYSNKLLKANLKYKEGLAELNLYKKRFNLNGQNFNDNFMKELFALSKFKGGSLDFAMYGVIDEYDGTLNISDTTILDYKILNNVLAFVNTIPSLLTFSLPGYNKKGLAVENAYMNFQQENDIFNITDINLESKEIDIVGRGKVNFKENTIDIKLNLITDLASAVSKIPVVGYVLFGKDSLSTSLKLDGKLDAPKVTSLLANELIVAPLNIIKRTLLLPLHLLSSEDDNSSK